MPDTSASHITYYHLCHRKLWLHDRQLRMEDNSQDVAAGKLIGRTSYRRRAGRWRELDLGAIKIDHFDPRARLIREVKKSPKLEHAHVAQVKYYLYHLEKRGISDLAGQIEYPRQRRTVAVSLSDTDRNHVIPGWEAEIDRICRLPDCPPITRKTYCRNCAFFDFCYV
jgi:CRISPR-associated exonuclease Cas4